MPNPQLSLQAQAAFEPSDAQRRLLEYIFSKPGFRTIQELCAGARVPRRTYYYWCENPAFRLWLATSWSALMLSDGIPLINVARLQCTRQYGYWKALFDLTFDPKGVGFLQHWQQSLAQANNAAFDLLAPAPENDAPDPTDAGPAEFADDTEAADDDTDQDEDEDDAPAAATACATPRARNPLKHNVPTPAHCTNRRPPAPVPPASIPKPHAVPKHLQKALRRSVGR